MSEPKLISPMLDNFDMGDPISEHYGVRCCPAMEKDSDNKYIVKIISTPASQSQLEALLLSGAYPDADAAAGYFKSLADGVVHEAETLQKLAQFDGFIPFTNWQLVPMDDGVGFDVYLLSEYRNTLQQHLRCGSLTHLAAINLGLDLCAALSACRRYGYLFANLKPNNIYYLNDHGYRIADIGFLRLDSLKYASLPDRYRSEYTAPEIADAFSSLNTTIDIYALGLILYQVYNDGVLPTMDESGVFAAPAYADYEMAEIILKACATDPEQRWQEPAEMGQALVSYMQRNGANDVPIVPVAVPQDSSFEDEEPAGDDIESEFSENDAFVSESEDCAACIAQEEAVVPTDDTEISEDQEITAEDIYTEDAEGNLTLLDDETDDETLPNDVSDEIIDVEITEEVSDILDQADELIAHPTPDPVVQPDPIEVQMPDSIESAEEISEKDTAEVSSDPVAVTEDSAEDATAGTAEDVSENAEENTVNEIEDASAGAVSTDEPQKKSSATAWIRNTLIAITAIALIVAGLIFYKNHYLQTIESISLKDGGNGLLTVYVDSPINDDKLTVICSDTYGNQLLSPVVDGKAEFHDLAPNAAYKVKVVIRGFHRLIGDTTAAYTTPQQTNIVQFTAVTGTEDGSVVLGFTIDGPDSEQWKIAYQDDNGQRQEIIFSGHVLTISTLTIGQTYHFELSPVADIQIAGVNTVEHTATSIVKAQSVMITGRVNNKLSVIWAAEDGVDISGWTVRCYGDNGYDQTLTTGETKATFEIPDEETDYTVEVTAAGMSVSERAYAPANAITVGNFKSDDSDPYALTITWSSTETVSNGWILSYTINGSAAHEIACKEGNQAVISPIVPGCEYYLTLKAADGRPVLGGIRVYNAPAAEPFEGYAVTSEYMEFSLCRTPSYSGWNRYDLSDDDYTTTFEVGEKASFLVRMRHEYNTSDDTIAILYAFRDQNDVVVWTSSDSSTWTNMWYRNYCELDIPSLPQTPGNYTVSIYFNGALAGECDLTIVDP